METPSGESFPILKVESFDEYDPNIILLKPGVFRITITIEDHWGAELKYYTYEEIVVRSLMLGHISIFLLKHF